MTRDMDLVRTLLLWIDEQPQLDGTLWLPGLLATQGIRGGANRTVLERIKESGRNPQNPPWQRGNPCHLPLRVGERRAQPWASARAVWSK
jgi:hypothetical protein